MDTNGCGHGLLVKASRAHVSGHFKGDEVLSESHMAFLVHFGLAINRKGQLISAQRSHSYAILDYHEHMSALTSFSPSSTITTRDVVAANVRAEAARAGFNQVRLGKRLGISQGAITKRWRGERPWQLEELDNLATALGVSVVDLVTPTGREMRLRQDSNLQPRD